MKNIYILLITTLFSGYTYSQVLAEQGFEDPPAAEAPAVASGSADLWTYTATPEAYNGASSGDKWDPTTDVGSHITGPNSGTKFWGIRDIENTHAGQSPGVEHYLTFSAVDVSAQTDVVVSFYYYTEGFDSTDTMHYEIFADDVSLGKTALDKDTESWVQVQVSIDDSVQSVYLVLYAKQNGTDSGGWDDVKIEAGVVPAPSISITPSNLDYKNGAMQGNDVIFDLTINNFTFSSSATAADGDGYIVWSYGNETPTQQFSSDDITITAPDPGSYQIIVTVTGNNGDEIVSTTADFWVTNTFTVPFTNNFDYGTEAGTLRAKGGHEWSIYSGSSNAADYATTSLSMTDYGPSGIGGSVVWEGATGYDYDLRFNPVSTGAVYASMLVSITSSKLDDPDYILGYRDEWDWSGNNDVAAEMNTKVYVTKNSDDSITFGLREDEDSTLYADVNHQLNTTYLIVIKYDFTSSSSSLYVLDSHTSTEPTVDGTGVDVTTTDDDAYAAEKINSFFIRQSNGGANDVVMDGLSISQTWSESLSIFSNFKNNVFMYPNPTDDYLNFVGLDKYTNIKIIDLTGKAVLSESFSKKLDVQNLNKGLYFVEVSNGTTTKNFKFLKK